MACLHSLALKGTAITFWLALFSTCMVQADSCRPLCAGSYCVTVHRVKADFKSADEMCRGSRGELLSLLPNDDILRALDYGGHGDFWIGLSLPEGTCTNLSSPLRGYRWTNASRKSDFSVNLWRDSARVCSPRCVSTSSDLKWAERPCSHEIEGFLCRTDHEHACQLQELTDYIRSAAGCSDAPCEHSCTAVKDGYRCSCYKGYAPDSQDPRRCKIHCAQEKCLPVCDPNDVTVCSCAEGFIRNENICEDIDECDMKTDECDHNCKNTFGGFRCTCNKGFALKDQVKCVESEDSEYLDIFTTAIVPAFVKPAPKNNTLKGASLSTGEFIGLWTCLAVLVIGLVCVVRRCALQRQKRMQQTSSQQMTSTQGLNL